MGTADDPDIEICIKDMSDASPAWVDYTAYAKSFRVVDGGIRSVPRAEVVFGNKDGIFTKPSGDNYIDFWDELRIQVNVRGTTDQIFYGKIFKPVECTYRGKELPLVGSMARHWYGIKLLKEKITRDYYDDGKRCKEAIENFLSNPNSGINTGISLSTDTGDIVNKPYPQNLKSSTLLEAIQVACDALGYDGYMFDLSTLRLKTIGTEPVWPSIHLQHPLATITPDFDMDELKNFIMVVGGSDGGFPPAGEWTENGVGRYSPAAWTATNGTVEDYATDKKLGANCVKFTKTVAAPTSAEAFLNIPDTEYVDPVHGTGYIDLGNQTYGQRMSKLYFWFKASSGPYPSPATPSFFVRLESSNGALIERNLGLYTREAWTEINYNIGPAYASEWTVLSGTFDWDNVQKIRFYAHQDMFSGNWILIDWLYFKGNFWSIDPIIFKSNWNQPVKDDESITNWGQQTHVYDEMSEKITCFELAQKIGKYFLEVNKYPFKRIKAVSKGKPWARPSQYLQLSLPEHEISSEDWRILEIEHVWERPKYLRTITTLVPKLYRFYTGTIQMETMAGLLKQVAKGY